jgi:chemotaxis protein methyltransferase CheR
MKADNFDFFCKFLQKQTGTALGPGKEYLVESRLAPIARNHKLADTDAVVAALKANANTPLVRECLAAMMTHESFFFRDIRPFDDFRKSILPGLIERRAGTRKLRVWCAAASTGQEPYSLAMILQEEAAKLAGWSIELVATDISPAALTYARDGLYTHFEVQRGLPAQMLVKYFAKEATNWRLSPTIRNLVSYREFNLLDDPAVLGSFDVVFCRNVLIYFDQDTKGRVLERIARRMPNDGVLFLGGAETVIGITTRFAPVTGYRGVYAPGSAPALAAAS